MASSSTTMPDDVLRAIRAAVAARERSKLMARGGASNPANPTAPSSSNVTGNGDKAGPKRSSQTVYHLLHGVNKDNPELGDGFFTKMLDTEKRMDSILSRHLARARSNVVKSVSTPSSAIMLVSHQRRPTPEMPGFLNMTIELRSCETGVNLSISDFLERLEVNFVGEDSVGPAYWDSTCEFASGSHGFGIPRCIEHPSTAVIDVYIKDGTVTPTPAFGRLIGIHSGTFDEIKNAFFLYVKTHNLADPHTHGIRCDRYLADLFQKSFISIETLSQKLYTQLEPRVPLKFNYAITHEMADSIFFKIDFRSPAVVDAMRKKFVKDATTTLELKMADDKLCDLANRIQATSHAKKVYEQIAENPHGSFLQIVKSQEEDFKNTNDADINLKHYPASFFKDNEAMKEAVSRYMHNNVKQKQFELNLNLDRGHSNNNSWKDFEKLSPYFHFV